MACNTVTRICIWTLLPFVQCSKINFAKDCSLKHGVLDCKGSPVKGDNWTASVEDLSAGIRAAYSTEEALAEFITSFRELRLANYASLDVIDFSINHSTLYKNLEKLIVQNTGLTRIPDHAFKLLQKIRFIEFIENADYRQIYWSSFMSCPTCESLLIDTVTADCTCDLLWLLNSTHASADNLTLIQYPRGVAQYAMTVWQHYQLPASIQLTNANISSNGALVNEQQCLAQLKSNCPIPFLHVEIDSPENKFSLVNGSLLLDARLLEAGKQAVDASPSTSSSISIIAGRPLRSGLVYENILKSPLARTILFKNVSQLDNNWIFLRVSNSSVSPYPMAKGVPLLVEGVPLIVSGSSQAHSDRSVFCHFSARVYPPYTYLGFNYTDEAGGEQAIGDNNGDDNDTFEFVTWDIQPFNPALFSYLTVTLNIPMVVMYHSVLEYKLVVCNSYGCASRLCNVRTLGTLNATALTAQYPLIYPSQNTKTASHKWPLVIVAMVLGTLLLFLCVLAVYYYSRRARNTKRNSQQQDEAESLELIGVKGTLPLMVENSAYSSADIGHAQFLNEIAYIRSSDLHLLGEIGEGAFGQVFLVECPTQAQSMSVYYGRPSTSSASAPHMPQQDTDRIFYAAKRLPISSHESLQSLRQEAGNLSKLDHKNIVNFEGVFRTDLPNTIYLLFEFMHFGSLRTFLQEIGPNASDSLEIVESVSNGQCFCTWKCAIDHDVTDVIPTSLTHKDLLDIAHQIAEGLVYLTANHFIHRDLAARNCLIGLGLVVKIGDFGMSKDLYMDNYYKSGGRKLLPVRWLPPEALLYGRYNQVTDVWSFGVVLWEIFTYGQQPWNFCSNKDVIEQVEAKKIMERPKGCPLSVYELMKYCWTFDHHCRPSATQVIDKLDDIILTCHNETKENCHQNAHS